MDKAAFLKPVDIYGVASCIGAQNVRCYSAPLVLQNLNLVQFLTEQNLNVQWIKTILLDDSADSIQDKYKAVAEICGELGSLVKQSLDNSHMFLTIGGDHSCAIGTWSGAATALKPNGDIGLIWIDAHMDAHTAITTPSDAIHGMPVASLLGHGVQQLVEVCSNVPKIKPSHLCLIGVRSYESEEMELLQKLGVKVFFIDEVHKRGFTTVFSEAVDYVKRSTCGFGISLDMDAIDPIDAPGVGSPEHNGIRADEVLSTFMQFDIKQNFIGFELAELNVFEDSDNKTAHLALELIKALFKE